MRSRARARAGGRDAGWDEESARFYVAADATPRSGRRRGACAATAAPSAVERSKNRGNPSRSRRAARGFAGPRARSSGFRRFRRFLDVGAPGLGVRKFNKLRPPGARLPERVGRASGRKLKQRCTISRLIEDSTSGRQALLAAAAPRAQRHPRDPARVALPHPTRGPSAASSSAPGKAVRARPRRRQAVGRFSDAAMRRRIDKFSDALATRGLR